MSALITIEHTVSVGYDNGDYAVLRGNGGSGDIDWNTALSGNIMLFPNAAGIYGWGHTPWGHFPWGHCHSMRTAGWGHLPWGHFPWGHGTAVIKATKKVSVCGEYKYGFACYDSTGNLHEGTPDEVTVHVHVAPAKPNRLRKNAYNKTTDVLILDAA